MCGARHVITLCLSGLALRTVRAPIEASPANLFMMAASVAGDLLLTLGARAQPGPFIKLGPLRNVAETAEKAGCLSGAGLVVILALALTGYGATIFQQVLWGTCQGLRTLLVCRRPGARPRPRSLAAAAPTWSNRAVSLALLLCRSSSLVGHPVWMFQSF